MAIYRHTPGFKGRTFKLCVLTRWDFNFCARSSPLRGSGGSERQTDRQTDKERQADRQTDRVNLFFEPNQPLGIISGLKETFTKRYIVERTDKAERGPEEQSEKVELSLIHI